MKFVAIDFETANPDLSSICQVGIVCFQDGHIVDQWESLINPEDYFDGMNTMIHGITETVVKNEPKFPDIYNTLMTFLQDNVVVCHTAFDRVALNQVVSKYELAQLELKWLDTAKVVRRAFSEFSYKGYGLQNVAEKLDIKFAHHNAREDARAAGEILLHAIKTTGIALPDWFERIKKPINPNHDTAARIAKDGDVNGPYYGEVMAFTGALQIPRHEAADIASKLGFQVTDGVNRHTTFLVVGNQDIRKLAGYEKSSKHRKAETLMAMGKSIRILTESNFKELASLDG